MSSSLRRYLDEQYSANGFKPYKPIKKDSPIQIDDQDDKDSLTEFCNIFVTVGKRNALEIEFCGGMPTTQEIADFAEIYHGHADAKKSRIVLKLIPVQVEALVDLAGRIRKTAAMGPKIGNPNWHKISARTVSSLYRFVRVIKEYAHLRKAGLL